MKTLIPVLLILASFAAGQVYTPSREIVDYRCDFCGAKIQKAEEVKISSWSIDPGMNMAWDPYFVRIPDSLRSQDYKFERKYTLCPKCWEDYHEELDKMYVQAFRKWFKHHERGFRKSWIKNNKILRAERVKAQQALVEQEKGWDPEYPVPQDARDPEEENRSSIFLKGDIYLGDTCNVIFADSLGNWR